MLIQLPASKDPNITLLLRKREAEELVEKLSYLLAHPEYHHDHLEDFENGSALTILIYDQVDQNTLAEDVWNLIRDSHGETGEP